MSAEHKHPGRDDKLSVAAGHELSDAEAGPLLKFLAFLLATTVVIAAMMVGFYGYLEHREAVAKAPRYPLAAEQPRSLPPPPRLQHHPFQDVLSLRQEEERLLRGYEWIDQSAGTVRIPIDRAIEVLAERGLPHRAAAPAGPGGDAVGEPLGPTRASSGRQPAAQAGDRPASSGPSQQPAAAEPRQPTGEAPPPPQ